MRDCTPIFAICTAELGPICGSICSREAAARQKSSGRQLIRPEQPERGVIATVTLRSHSAENFHAFHAVVRETPQPSSIKMSGGPIHLRFVCADLESCHAASDGLLNAGPGVAQLGSHVVLASIKPFCGSPLEDLG